jgi:hypothetical protein
LKINELLKALNNELDESNRIPSKHPGLEAASKKKHNDTFASAKKKGEINRRLARAERSNREMVLAKENKTKSPSHKPNFYKLFMGK